MVGGGTVVVRIYQRLPKIDNTCSQIQEYVTDNKKPLFHKFGDAKDTQYTVKK